MHLKIGSYALYSENKIVFVRSWRDFQCALVLSFKETLCDNLMYPFYQTVYIQSSEEWINTRVTPTSHPGCVPDSFVWRVGRCHNSRAQ